MQVKPKSEKEVRQFSMLAPGIYDFEVLEATEKVSSAGNDMIELKLSILGENDRTHIVFDYLVNTDEMAYKLRHFAASIGLLAEYEAGNLPTDRMESRAGKARIVIQPAKGQYDEKNTVRDYIAADGPIDSRLPTQPKQTTKEELNDDVPF